MKSGQHCINCGNKYYWFDPCCAQPLSKTQKQVFEEKAHQYFLSMPKPPHHMVYSNADVNEARRLGFIDGLKHSEENPNPTK